MSIFEYISVLSSIIVGFGITQLLRGVVQMIHNPEESKPCLVHLLWMLSTFLLSIFWWWFQFILADVSKWTFSAYSFVIVYAVTIYLLCAVLVPANVQRFGDYKTFFYSNRHWFFGIFILQRMVDILDTLAKGGLERFFGFGPEYYVAGPVEMLLAGIAIYTRNEKYHLAFAVAIILFQIAIVIRLFPTMGA